jgi:carboxymethylenebutenolidase
MKADRDRLAAAVSLYDRFTHEGMDRRLFMARLTRIAGGAAAANLLLSNIAAASQAAPQVAADDARLCVRTGWRDLSTGRRYSGYAAILKDAPPRVPAVLVIHENRGLNGHIRDVARRLALAGYLALAPDFLSPAGGTPADEDAARRMIGALNMPDAVADGVAMIDHLRDRVSGRRKVGIVGFCWGGAMVHRIALAAGNRLGAGVSFYGPAPDPAEAARLQSPLLVVLAGRDQRVNATAQPYVAAARGLGKPVRAITYPDVDHAFHNDTSAARYNEAAAAAAWAETLRFFDRHLR